MPTNPEDDRTTSPEFTYDDVLEQVIEADLDGPASWALIPGAGPGLDPTARWDDIARHLAATHPTPPAPDLSELLDQLLDLDNQDTATTRKSAPASTSSGSLRTGVQLPLGGPLEVTAARSGVAMARSGAAGSKVAVARFKRALRAHTGPFDLNSAKMTLRLADLLAASGNHAEALFTYRTVLNQAAGGGDERKKAARRAAAVAGHSSLHNVDELVADLQRLIPGALAEDAQATNQVFAELEADAEQSLRDLARVDADLQDWKRIAPGSRSEGAEEVLEARAIKASAVQNSASARIQIAESAALNDPLPVSILIEALLDSEHHLSFQPIASRRGHRHPMRFADMVAIESPLPHGSYQEHLLAVLDERCHPKLDATVRDVIYLTGSAPERSQVLIDTCRQEHHLNERTVIINCPYLLRTRSENHDVVHAHNLDQPAPYETLSGVVVTSLGWAGAADIAALLARNWGWGFAASTRSKLEGYARDRYPFGDWFDNVADAERHVELANEMLSMTSGLIDALPVLTKRVFALDEPRAAARALTERSLLSPPGNPLALVMIRMSERRIRWVARHMLSSGGQHDVNSDRVEQRVRDLLQTQDDLTSAVTRHQDPAVVLVVDLDDHLDDGYANSRSAVDPVDADFDGFYDTAELVRSRLEQQTTELTADVGTVQIRG